MIKMFQFTIPDEFSVERRMEAEDRNLLPCRICGTYPDHDFNERTAVVGCPSCGHKVEVDVVAVTPVFEGLCPSNFKELQHREACTVSMYRWNVLNFVGDNCGRNNR